MEITSKCKVIENASTVNGNISESIAKNSNVMANTSIAKENTGESNAKKSSVMESKSIINENTSNTKKSDVKDNASKSESGEHTNSLTNSGVNLVSPGSSLNSVPLSGGAEAHLSSAGDLHSLSADLVSSGPGLVSVFLSVSSGFTAPSFFSGNLGSVARVSNIPSGLSIPKGSGPGVSKPAAARPSGLCPGLRKVVTEWSLMAQRKR